MRILLLLCAALLCVIQTRAQTLRYGPHSLPTGTCKVAYHPNANGGRGADIGIFFDRSVSPRRVHLLVDGALTPLANVSISTFGHSDTAAYDPASDSVLVTNGRQLYAISSDHTVTRRPDLPTFGSAWSLISVPTSSGNELFALGAETAFPESTIVTRYQFGLWIPRLSIPGGHPGRPFWHAPTQEIVWHRSLTNHWAGYDPSTNSYRTDHTDGFTPIRSHYVAYVANPPVLFDLSGDASNSAAYYRSDLREHPRWRSFQSVNSARFEMWIGDGDVVVQNHELRIYRPGHTRAPLIADVSHLALTSTYGTGCRPSSGGGRPLAIEFVSGRAGPTPGQPVVLPFAYTTPNAPLILGIGSQPTSVDLSPAGFPGCSQWAAFDIAESAGLPTDTFHRYWLAIPRSPSLLGARAFVQGVQLVASANPSGALFSNGIELVIGERW